ncbi:MAG: alanine--glyoxylate aminotransferase family protein [Thermoflexales bacterium]|nr:alanine--glyoxylate aminotransferase family protein [Thermoflexales bacterium]
MTDHIRLFNPGPVEVRRKVLDAQTGWMISHRGKAFETLFARIQLGLRAVFETEHRVFVSTSSGTGLWEAAARNCVGDDPARGVLALVCGDFSERWADVFARNGKYVEVLSVPRGRANPVDALAAALRTRATPFDAVAWVDNETSTGVHNPTPALAEAIRALAPDTLTLVDAVSSAGGDRVATDAWGLDVVLTSSQKCFGLPPGLAFAAVSDRALARAAQIPNRGYYFDFIELEAFLRKNSTPSTPALSLLNALDRQLADMQAEGLPARYARHAEMARMTQDWALENGFGLFAEPGARSNTVTVVSNARGIDLAAINAGLARVGMSVAEGYGPLKGSTFRIAHMGDTQPADLHALLTAFSALLPHG